MDLYTPELYNLKTSVERHWPELFVFEEDLFRSIRLSANVLNLTLTVFLRETSELSAYILILKIIGFCALNVSLQH